MDIARADALAARSRLAEGRHWIPRRSESFRHLPPPPAEVWLGDAPDANEALREPSALSDAGWTLHPLSAAASGRIDARWLDAADPVQRAELFAGLPQPGDDEAAPFAWAHRALCRQGLRLRIGGARDGQAGDGQTVWLQLRRQPRLAVEAPLLVIDLMPGVRCVLIESHERDVDDRDADDRDAHDREARGRESAGRESTSRELDLASGERAVVQNLQVHLHLGAGSSLQHLRVALPDLQDRTAQHVRVRLDREAAYAQGLIGAGSAYHLQRTVLELAGAQSCARVGAALFGHGGSVLEQQVRTHHAADHTCSEVESLALAQGASQLVVNAHTAIAPGADEAAARQRLNGIPTGGRPKIVLRPHLEIHHDQVQAAHGATWGALPDEALFYACQRGLSEQAARALVVEGMAQSVLARSLDEPGLMDAPEVAALLARTVARHLATPAEASHG